MTHDVMVTAYGEVKLSKKTVNWLNTLHPKWREFQKKKRKSKEFEHWQRDMRRLEIMVSTAAEIEWVAMGTLEVV